MPDGSTLALFAAAAIALLLIPGPAVLYIVSQSIDQGRAAGLVSVLGIATGSLVQVAAAAAGISSLIAASATAFTTVKLVGAAYLLYLGVRRLLTREQAGQIAARGPRPKRRLYSQGVLVNVFNPKTAIFFLAFLPQFVSSSRGSVTAQALILGLLFVGLGLLSDGLWAIAAGTAAGWLRGNARFLKVQRYVSGSVFIALGIAAAAARSARST